MDLTNDSNATTLLTVDHHHPYNQRDTATTTNENEKLIRLEYENEKLRKELQNSNDERIRLLESQLDDEKNRVSRLELENRLNSKKIIELEGRLKDDQLVNNDNNGQSRLKLKELQMENNNLKIMLDKKNDELAEREERFRKHLNKAKETYGLLETHMNNSKLSTQSLPLDSKIHQPQQQQQQHFNEK
ncbi:hypothetical protein BLA29_012134, partial [Euroglyphus maynei]